MRNRVRGATDRVLVAKQLGHFRLETPPAPRQTYRGRPQAAIDLFDR